MDDHLPSAEPTELSGEDGSYQLTLRNSGSSPRFFKSPDSPCEAGSGGPCDSYTFYVDDDLTLRIRGTVVWVVPDGACFRRNVRVVPLEEGSPGTLVLVAKANRRDPGYENRGLWLKGGLTVTEEDVRVFLVSEGDIAITRTHNRDESQDARRVSIVAAGDVELGGPLPGSRQRFLHNTSEMAPLAQQLMAQGALPTLSAGSAIHFVLARSSWVETSTP